MADVSDCLDKLLLCCCIGFTLIVLASRASDFMGWTSHTAVLEEDNDESDVDILSISSGDDDSTAKDQQRVHFRGGKAVSAATARCGSRGDDDAA
ncbi:hypothetical protein TB2_047143 [Malus domestica]